MSNPLPPMTEYVGIKMISACPMTLRQAKSEYGVKVGDSSTADHGDEGYLVRYKDGYVSWSPKAVFDESHRPTDDMSYAVALTVATMGLKVSRRKWRAGRYIMQIVNDVGAPVLHMYFENGVHLGIDECGLDSQANDYYVVDYGDS